MSDHVFHANIITYCQQNWYVSLLYIFLHIKVNVSTYSKWYISIFVTVCDNINLESVIWLVKSVKLLTQLNKYTEN